ncbi:MAG: glucarate dehydratase [Saprospiraceae bacterium]|nr:glucarate dehydratase [Saprospiraceae bacterium]
MKNPSLQVTNLIITPIAVGDPPLLNAAGLHAPYALRIIIELETNAGITGISEIPGSEQIRLALQKAKPLILGQHPFQMNSIKGVLAEHFGEEVADQRGNKPWDQRQLIHVFSALEVAALDIMGKLLNEPVVNLLGGKARDRVPFAAYLFYKYEGAGGALGFGIDPNATGWEAGRQKEALSPAQIVEQAQSMCDAFGFQSIKLKGGALEPALECESILALRKAFGTDMPLRLDPNAIWSLETAVKYGKQMEGVLEYYEDPVRGQENMSRLAKLVNIPLATNMCTTSFADLPGSIRKDSEQIILSDHHFWGGLRASMELYRVCATFGRGFSMHSNSHLGISLAAMVHLGAAIPEMTYDLDTHYPWQLDEVIKGGKLPIVNGCVEVPRGPGLGVEIDQMELQRLHENYKTCGLTERDDQAAMQAKQPGWQFQPQRW